jgi:hypothetical protein
MDIDGGSVCSTVASSGSTGASGLTKRGPDQDSGPVGCHSGVFVFYLINKGSHIQPTFGNYD